jgi:uncharacterized protein YbaP (TraB family)
VRRLLALCLTVYVGAALAQTEPETEAAPEQVLLVGQRPGPGLWKVSKDGHVLWVLGTYSPLPQKMEWRSQQVETVLAQSQEYLTPPGAHAGIGFFRGLTMLPSLIGIKKNPDGATLRDVLPPEVYARWLPLKAKYLGDSDSIERERPIFAAETLFSAGLKQAGLTRGTPVNSKIYALVKQYKVKVIETGIKLDMDGASDMVKDFKKSSLADVACFDKTLTGLESDIDAMRVRANAWAKGDIEVIQKLSYADRESECDNAMLSADFVKNHASLQNVKERMRTAWLASAEQAIGSNISTFGVLPLSNILGADSYLAALKAKGYQVDSPD